LQEFKKKLCKKSENVSVGEEEMHDISTDASKSTSHKSSADYKTAELLVQAGFDAIRRLQENYILKPYGQDGDGNLVYSILHDGFGPALDKWGEIAQEDFNDVRFSVVEIYGRYYNWKYPIQGITLKGNSWIGCALSEVTFQEVTFRNCRFDGTWFNGCSFIDCKFEGCYLLATGFDGCTWKNVMVVSDCDCRGLLVQKSIWSGVKFTSSNLSSGVIENITLDGNLHFDACIVHYGQIRSFHGKKTHISAHKCDLYGALFSDYDEKDPQRFSDNHISENITQGPPKKT
jgi:uncharacterized protein YjbI with pentapeptide repeats